MASVVLDNSQFSSAPNQNVLVADGLKLGGAGLTLAGGITSGGAINAQEVNAYWNPTNPNILQNTLNTNGGGTDRVMGNAVGSTTTDNAYYTNAQQVNYQCPTWNATYNYAGVHNAVLIVYGTNTSAAGVYPNNIFFADDAAPTPPVVCVPPTPTPAPYPVSPAVNPGWVLAKDAAFFGGAAVVNGTGFMELLETRINGTSPAVTTFFGGGGQSIGAAVPRGVTIQEADISTITGNNGALLDVAGLARCDGLFIHDTDQNLSPASSANANFSGAPNAFQFGNNYVWSPTGPGATTYHWDVNVTPGVAGQITLSGGAAQTAFDPQCIMMVTRKFVTGATTAIGNICVDSKTATTIVISSRASADQSLVAADVGQIEWICFNPNWTT